MVFLFFKNRPRPIDPLPIAPPAPVVSVVPSQPTVVEEPSPVKSEAPTPPVVDEAHWKKDLEKIKQEEARQKAAHPTGVSKFESLGYTCNIAQTEMVVIKSQKAWEKLLSRMGHHKTTMLFPDIDFTHRMIIAVFTGEQPFNEKSLLIDSQEFRTVNRRQKLFIKYKQAFLPKGSSVTTLMIQPYHLRVFPLYTGTVEFEKELSE